MSLSSIEQLYLNFQCNIQLDHPVGGIGHVEPIEDGRRHVQETD